MSRTKPERNVIALVQTMVVRAAIAWNAPVRGWIGTAAVDVAHQCGDEMPVEQRDAGRLDRPAQLPAELEPAAFGIEHAREVEPARWPARIAAVLGARKAHA